MLKSAIILKPSLFLFCPIKIVILFLVAMMDIVLRYLWVLPTCTQCVPIFLNFFLSMSGQLKASQK